MINQHKSLQLWLWDISLATPPEAGLYNSTAPGAPSSLFRPPDPPLLRLTRKCVCEKHRLILARLCVCLFTQESCLPAVCRLALRASLLKRSPHIPTVTLLYSCSSRRFDQSTLLCSVSVVALLASCGPHTPISGLERVRIASRYSERRKHMAAARLTRVWRAAICT